MVIAWAWQVVQNYCCLSIEVEATDASRMATFGNIEAPFMKCQAVDWRSQSLGQEQATAIRCDPPDTSPWRRTTEGESRLGQVYYAHLVKGQAGRERKALRHEFKAVTARISHHKIPYHLLRNPIDVYGVSSTYDDIVAIDRRSQEIPRCKPVSRPETEPCFNIEGVEGRVGRRDEDNIVDYRR